MRIVLNSLIYEQKHTTYIYVNQIYRYLKETCIYNQRYRKYKQLTKMAGPEYNTKFKYKKINELLRVYQFRKDVF